jgi:hypothetical protein
MGNNLSIIEQLALFRDVMRAKPIISAALVILALIGIFFGNTEPTLWRLSALLAESDRQIETLVVVNPNVDVKQVFVELSASGQPLLDLGINQSTALDLDNKSTRQARLNVGERSVSVVTILRKKEQLPSLTRAVPPTVQPKSSDSIMRQIAISYLVGLLLYAQSFIKELTFGWAALTLFSKFTVADPREWKETAQKHLGNIAGWRSTTRRVPGPPPST